MEDLISRSALIEKIESTGWYHKMAIAYCPERR